MYLTVGQLMGGGIISADGGASIGYGGGGGGGRIAIYYYESSTFTGTISAFGGSGYEWGGAGTIYTQASSEPLGDLLVDNGGHAGAGTRLVDGTYTFDTVEVRGKAILELSHGALVVGVMVIDEDDDHVPQSCLDLGRAGLIADYPDGTASPIAEIAAWVRAGLNAPSGYWNGNGITSREAAADPDKLTAVGVLDNADPGAGGKTEFAGQAVDASSVLVAYTWWGDANLDGIVNSNDYDRIDSNWLLQTPNPRWATGDFNYDGVINSNDYDKIDTAWLLSGGATLAGAVLPMPAPEPATLALLAAGAPVAQGEVTLRSPVPETAAVGVDTDLLAGVAGLPLGAEAAPAATMSPPPPAVGSVLTLPTGSVAAEPHVLAVVVSDAASGGEPVTAAPEVFLPSGGPAPTADGAADDLVDVLSVPALAVLPG